MGIGNIILLAALIYGIIGFVEGYIDGQNSLNGRDIEHKISFIVRVLVAILVWILLIGTSVAMPILIIPIILLINSVGVDTGFNHSSGFHIGYIGKTSEWDKFIRKTPIGADGVLYQMIKVFVAGVILFIALT